MQEVTLQVQSATASILWKLVDSRQFDCMDITIIIHICMDACGMTYLLLHDIVLCVHVHLLSAQSFPLLFAELK